MADRLKSRSLRLRVWGDNACFTRPEMKVERVSYDVITPAAARGILEAILWKPAISWTVTRIDVLKPIRWESVRRNEVGGVIPASDAASAMRRGNGCLGMYVEDQRQQRAGLFLRDVAYTIHAYFELIDLDQADQDTVFKFQEMFLRRTKKGQCFHRPYLGCREFGAHFEALAHDQPDPKPIDETRDLGWMLLDLDYSSGAPVPQFFRANMDQGRISVPALERQVAEG